MAAAARRPRATPRQAGPSAAPRPAPHSTEPPTSCRAAARVARLQREPECVDRHVRPALVDHADDPERHALLTDPKAAGQACCRGAPHRPGRAGLRPAEDRTRYPGRAQGSAPGGPASTRECLRPLRCRDRRRSRPAPRGIRANISSAAACNARFFVSVFNVARVRGDARSPGGVVNLVAQIRRGGASTPH